MIFQSNYIFKIIKFVFLCFEMLQDVVEKFIFLGKQCTSRLELLRLTQLIGVLIV